MIAFQSLADKRLLSCPCCAGLLGKTNRPHLEQLEEGTQPMKPIGWLVACHGCGIQTRLVATAEEAIGIWNHRTTRTMEEVGEVRDLLHPILTGELPIELHEGDQLAVSHILPALCWVLRHSHENHLEIFVTRLREIYRENGIKFVRVQ